MRSASILGEDQRRVKSVGESKAPATELTQGNLSAQAQLNFGVLAPLVLLTHSSSAGCKYRVGTTGTAAARASHKFPIAGREETSHILEAVDLRVEALSIQLMAAKTFSLLGDAWLAIDVSRKAGVSGAKDWQEALHQAMPCWVVKTSAGGGPLEQSSRGNLVGLALRAVLKLCGLEAAILPADDEGCQQLAQLGILPSEAAAFFLWNLLFF